MIKNIKFELIDEFRLDKLTKLQIASLLKQCFPEEEFEGRTYFKQLPHYRLLIRMNENLIGQLGLDYRIMKLGKKIITVLGIIDLAISPNFQRQGLGTQLLKKLDSIAENNLDNLDFLFLCTDKHKFYENCGYKLIKQKVKWLTLENGINYGLQEKEFDNCLMVKQVGEIEWEENIELDMFGYWY